MDASGVSIGQCRSEEVTPIRLKLSGPLFITGNENDTDVFSASRTRAGYYFVGPHHWEELTSMRVFACDDESKGLQYCRI